MNSYISDNIILMVANGEKRKKLINNDNIDLDNSLNHFDLDEKLPDGKLRVVYSKEENLMIIELLSEGNNFYYFYFVDESDKNKYKGGWVGMLILAYGDKYWRDNLGVNQNFIEWGDDIAQKIMKIKKGN